MAIGIAFKIFIIIEYGYTLKAIFFSPDPKWRKIS